MEEKSKISKPVVVSDKKIKDEIKAIISDSYGVFGIEKQNNISDLTKIKKGNEDAIFVWRHTDGSYSLDIYLILSADVKITETLSEVQNLVDYKITKKLGIKIRKINIYAESIVSL